MKVVIIGTGGHAQDVAVIARRCGHDPELVEEKSSRAHSANFIGINDAQTRAEVAARWDHLSWVDLADPDSIGARQLPPGCVAAPRSLFLTAPIELGEHVHVNYGAQMTRCTIGDFTTIAPGVTICGDVTIGARTMIGAGAVIKNLVTIGSDVIVGAGAVVVNDVPDGATVKGVPAK